MNTPFSTTSFIKSGWQTFKTHWKFLIMAAIATMFVQFVLNILQRGSDHSGIIIGLIVSVFAGIVGIVVALGWTRVLLALNRNNAADWDTFKTEPKLWLHFVKVMVWYALYFIMWVVPIIIIPTVLAIVGYFTNIDWLMLVGTIIAGIGFTVVAIYFAVRYQFVNFAVLDYQGLRSRAVFKKSGELTRGHLWQLIGLNILLGLLNILGAICLMVGLFVTIPVSKLASARAYDYLKNK